MRATLRRVAPAEEEALIVTPNFVIDLAAERITVPPTGDGADDVEIHLTPTEWRMVELLARHPGKLVTQRQILQHVLGSQYETETNYLRVYFGGLRKKLEPTQSQLRCLITEPGMGHCFELPADPDPGPLIPPVGDPARRDCVAARSSVGPSTGAK